MQICRVSKLKGFGGIIFGKDGGDILADGHVYSVEENCGTLILRDLGEHQVNYERGTSWHVVISTAEYAMTKQEYENEGNV